MICSTTCSLAFFSSLPGVAETYITCPILSSNSFNFNGLLSFAEGRRKPNSTKVFLREASPAYIPRNCGKVTCDSSITVRKSGISLEESSQEKVPRVSSPSFALCLGRASTFWS